MFSKNEKADARVAPSIISANLHVVGNLRSEGEIHVDGTVQGDVTGLSVAVGERAKVAGEITADEAVVHGIVEGRIRAKRVQLTKTARVIGDIWQEVLAIEAGAHIEGHIKRLDSDSRVPLAGDNEKPLPRIGVAVENPAPALGQKVGGR